MCPIGDQTNIQHEQKNRFLLVEMGFSWVYYMWNIYNMGLESLSSSVDVLEDLRTIISGSPLFAGLVPWLFGLTRTFISGGTKTF